MTDPESFQRWKDHVRQVIEDDFGNEEFQKLHWFNNTNFIASPDEAVNALRDLNFEQFIDDSQAKFSETQKQAARKFLSSVKVFCQKTPQVLNPAEVIGNPLWINLRYEAQKLVPVLFPEPKPPFWPGQEGKTVEIYPLKKR